MKGLALARGAHLPDHTVAVALCLLTYFSPLLFHSYVNVWNSVPLLTWYKTRRAEIMALWKGAQDYLWERTRKVWGRLVTGTQ